MKQIEIQQKLSKSGLSIFTKVEFRRIVGGTQISCQKILERYTKQGIFVRLKGSLYTLASNMPSEYLIANQLYAPSYISFETALSFYGIIPETVFSFTCATTKTTRVYKINNRIYSYHKIKKNAFVGYELKSIGQEKIYFAEKEKALADYYYMIYLKKRKLNDRIRLNTVDRQKVIRYAAKFENAGFEKWVKYAV